MPSQEITVWCFARRGQIKVPFSVSNLHGGGQYYASGTAAVVLLPCSATAQARAVANLSNYLLINGGIQPRLGPGDGFRHGETTREREGRTDA